MTETSPSPEPQAYAVEPILGRSDRGGVSVLTMNRPKARNALSMDLMAALIAEFERLDDDPAVGAVVLQGAGPAFCAGHDLRELQSSPTRDAYEQVFARCSKLMLTITRLSKPVIAKVQGIATAAGCQLVATCDLAVAAEDARFATPGVNIGLFCSTPMVALSRGVGRKAAMEMLLTGDMITAERAVAIGLINRCVPVESLDESTMAVAGQIAGKSPLALAIGKEAFYRQLELPLDEAYAYAGEVMTRNMMTRDAAEGIDAFLGKRQPKWKGC